MQELDMKSKKIVRTAISERRDSVKHESNSTKNMQVQYIVRTALR